MTTGNAEKIIDRKSMEAFKEKGSVILHTNALYNKKQFNNYKLIIFIQFCLLAYMLYFIFNIYQSQSLYVIDKAGYTYNINRSTAIREKVEVNSFVEDFIRHQIVISKNTYKSQREYIRPLCTDDYYRQLFNEDQKDESLTKLILRSDYAEVLMPEFAVEKTEQKGKIFHVTFNSVRNVKTGTDELPEEFRAMAIVSIVKRTKLNPFGLKLYSVGAPEASN